MALGGYKPLVSTLSYFTLFECLTARESMSVSRAIKVYMHTNQLQACPLKAAIVTYYHTICLTINVAVSTMATLDNLSGSSECDLKTELSSHSSLWPDIVPQGGKRPGEKTLHTIYDTYICLQHHILNCHFCTLL